MPTIWDLVPEGFHFIGVTRVGRGTAFKNKPTWNDRSNTWMDLKGGDTHDMGLMMDAIPHDQAPALMTKPPQDLSAARHTQDPALIKNLVGHSSDVVVIDEKADVPEVTELPKPPPGMVSDLNAPKATHFPPDAPTMTAMQLVKDREAARVASVPKTMLVETKTDLVNPEAAWAEGTAYKPQLAPMPVVQDRTVFGAPKPHVPEAIQELRNNGGTLPRSTIIGEGIVEARHNTDVPHYTDGGVCLHCVNASNALEELEPSEDKGVVTEVVTPKKETGKLVGIVNQPTRNPATELASVGPLGGGIAQMVVSSDPATIAIAEAFELLYALLPRAEYECLTAKVKQIRALATKVHR